jgi:hypothetical protein
VARPRAIAPEPTPRADSLEKPLWTDPDERRNDLKTLIYRRFPAHGSCDESSSRRCAAALRSGGDEIDLAVTARE